MEIIIKSGQEKQILRKILLKIVRRGIINAKKTRGKPKLWI